MGNFLYGIAFLRPVCPVSSADTQTPRTQHVTCIASPLASTFSSCHKSFPRMDDPHRALGYAVVESVHFLYAFWRCVFKEAEQLHTPRRCFSLGMDEQLRAP